MARNYVDGIISIIDTDPRFDAVLDIMGNPDTLNMAKWNALDDIKFTGVNASDLIMLAFAAGRNFENAKMAEQVGKLFS